MVGFNLAYLIGDVYVLFIPSYQVFALWMALGIAAATETPGSLHPRERWVAVAFLALPLWMAVSGYSQLDRSGDVAAKARWERILALPLPQGAVLVSNDRDEMVPLYYFQRVEGRRRDLLPLYPLITPELEDIGLVLDRALASGRKVFAIKAMPGLEVAYRLEEWHGLVKVRGPVTPLEGYTPSRQPVSEELDFAGHKLLRKSEAELCVALYWLPRRRLSEPLHSYLHLVDAQGRRLTGSDHRPGGDFYPTTLWKPGRWLEDVHCLAPPAGGWPQELRFRAGFYRWPSVEPYGRPVEFAE